LQLTNSHIMKYALSDNFTAKPERANFWRKLDGRNQFRVISDNFIEVFSQWVKRADGQGYTRTWPFDQPRPELAEGETFEAGNPSRKVVFCVSPVEGHDGGAPAILIVNQTVAKQMLALATELQGLTVADFVVIAEGVGKNKTFSVIAQAPSPLNPELHEMGSRFDMLAEL
jgi:hypothetical protein